MRNSTILAIAIALLAGGAFARLHALRADDRNTAMQDQNQPQAHSIYDFTMRSLSGEEVDLSRYRGKVVLLVNTASKCGYTPQYGPLEALHKKYAAQGLAILGFPANDFGHQEPGTDSQISEFCTKNYGVDFDMFSKIVVTGADKNPLYRYLTSPSTDPQFPGEVKWNFEKFLINRKGEIVARYRSAVKPDSPEVVHAIEAELAR